MLQNKGKQGLIAGSLVQMLYGVQRLPVTDCPMLRNKSHFIGKIIL